MHPLSLFPSLLTWQMVSPLLIRLVLGAVFVYRAYRSLARGSATVQGKILAIAEAIAGVLLVVGLWTQAAALFAAIDLIWQLVGRIMKKAFLTDGINYYLILLVMALSLLFTGPGFLAFDLPL